MIPQRQSLQKLRVPQAERLQTAQPGEPRHRRLQPVTPYAEHSAQQLRSCNRRIGIRHAITARDQSLVLVLNTVNEKASVSPIQNDVAALDVCKHLSFNCHQIARP